MYYSTTAHILYHYHDLLESGSQGGSTAEASDTCHTKGRPCFEEGTLRNTDDRCRQSSILEFMTKSTSPGPLKDIVARGAGSTPCAAASAAGTSAARTSAAGASAAGTSAAGNSAGTEVCSGPDSFLSADAAGDVSRSARGSAPTQEVTSFSKLSVMSRSELSDTFAKTLAIFDAVPARLRDRDDDGQAKKKPPSANAGHGRCVPRPPSLAGRACPHCGSAGRSLVANEGYLVCPECDAVEFVMIESERPSYREAPREISYFCYKRQNHFQEWISQTQGREYTNIPDSVFDMILVELKKQKMTNVATLTPKKLKEIMRKLGLNKYYEHLQFLLNHLSGAPLAKIPPELEAQLRRMFQQIQVPFMRHAPVNRRNFLSYSFCLHKMLQLLEHDDLLQHFPLLKSREKLHQQDLIWKAICEDLGWQWIRSA